MKTFFFTLFSLFSLVSYSQLNWEHTDGPFGAGYPYMYSNDEYVFVPEEDFLYRSSDGIQWEKIDREVTTFMRVYQDTLLYREYDFTLHKLLLHISTDNGESWVTKEMPSFIQSYNHLDIVLSGHGLYWVQDDKMLYKSVDLGDSWDVTVHPMDESFVDLALFDDRLYMYYLNELWRTDSSGENWEEIILPIQLFPGQYLNDFIVSGPNIVIASKDYIFHSHDDGNNWEEVPMFSGSAEDKIVLAGDVVYADMFDALYRTSDFGINWDTLADRFTYPFFINLGALRDIFLGGTFDDGIYRYDESTGKLLESNDGLSKGHIYNLDAGVDKIWAASGYDVFAYNISETKWSDRMDLPDVLNTYSLLSANRNGWVIAGLNNADSFYLTVNEGQSWDVIHTYFAIHNLELLGDHIFAFSDQELMRSIDQGLQWETIALDFYDRTFIPFQGKNYLLGNDSLYFTADNGISWDATGISLDMIQLRAFEDLLYGITITEQETDLYISSDGVDWTHAGEGFPKIYWFDFLNNGNSFFFRDAENHYAFLGSDGHWMSPVDDIDWNYFEFTEVGRDYVLHDNIIYLGLEGVYSSEILNPITAIKDVQDRSENIFTISPNPATGLIHIAFNPEINNEGLLQFFSPQGVALKTIPVDYTIHRINIPINDLSVGLYYIVFTNPGARSVRSFFIGH